MVRLIATVSALVGLAFVGRGYLNGDIAAYCAQAWAQDLADRTVHLGYVALAAGLAPLAGLALPLWLDVINVIAGAVAVAAAPRLAPATPHAAGFVALALVLPWSPFAEVDVPWMAMVLAAAAGVPGALGLGVALSPTTLLATPWVAWHRRRAGPLIEAGVAVVLLTIASGGDWWWGPRGVLEPRTYLLGRNLGTWLATVPWLVVLTGRPLRALRPAGALLPLLLAPADVPAAALVCIVCVAATLHPLGNRVGEAARTLAIVGALGVGALEAQQRADRVRAEQTAIVDVIRRLEPGDGLVAPFTWGARTSVIATGDPYGLPWRLPGGFLRDQEIRWAHVDGKILVLPPLGSATPPHPSGAPAP